MSQLCMKLISIYQRIWKINLLNNNMPLEIILHHIIVIVRIPIIFKILLLLMEEILHKNVLNHLLHPYMKMKRLNHFNYLEIQCHPLFLNLNQRNLLVKNFLFVFIMILMVAITNLRDS